MQNTSPIRHIAITCPHCGKRYRKVPYEAIKKYSTAFCKQCNAKFHITADELEAALQQAVQASQVAMPAAQTAEPVRQEHPEAQQEHAPAAARSEAEAVQDRAEEIPVHDQALEQKISTLAATMEETFSQPPASEKSPPAENSLTEQQKESAAAEPPSDTHAEAAADAAAAAAPETGSLQIENLPDLPPPVKSGSETEMQQPLEQDEAASHREETVSTEQLPVSNVAEELTAEHAAEAPAGVDQPDGFDTREGAAQTIPGAADLPAAEPEPAGLSPDEQWSRAYAAEPPAGDAFPAQPASMPEEGHGAEAQSAETRDREDITLPEPEAGPDDGMSPELTFAATGMEAGPVEPLDDASRETETQQAPEQDAAGAPREDTAPIEQQPVSDLAEASADTRAAGVPAGGEEPPPEPEPLSFAPEPAADEPVADTSLPQDTWPDVVQTTGMDESLSGQPEPPAEATAGESGDTAPAADQLPASPEEEFLDESLIEDEPEPDREETPSAEPIPEKPRTDQAGEPLPPQPDATLFDSLQDTDGNRDVSAMLKQLALPADEIEEGMEQFVLFSLGQQTFAAPIANVFELSLPPELISVPNTPSWIRGISNMRGEIISVVNFKGFMNIEPEKFKKPIRMIIAQTLDKDMIVGLLVDRINCIKYFFVEAIQPLEQHEPGLPDAFFLGTCMDESEAVVFLDLEQILQSPKMRQFQ